MHCEEQIEALATATNNRQSSAKQRSQTSHMNQRNAHIETAYHRVTSNPHATPQQTHDTPLISSASTHLHTRIEHPTRNASIPPRARRAGFPRHGAIDAVHARPSGREGDATGVNRACAPRPTPSNTSSTPASRHITHPTPYAMTRTTRSDITRAHDPRRIAARCTCRCATRQSVRRAWRHTCAPIVP